MAPSGSLSQRSSDDRLRDEALVPLRRAAPSSRRRNDRQLRAGVRVKAIVQTGAAGHARLGRKHARTGGHPDRESKRPGKARGPLPTDNTSRLQPALRGVRELQAGS